MEHEVKIEIEIETDDNYIYVRDVILTGNVELEDDSFDYAGTHCTHGIGGTQRYEPYLIAEEIDIIHSRLSADIVKIIQEDIENHSEYYEAIIINDYVDHISY